MVEESPPSRKAADSQESWQEPRVAGNGQRGKGGRLRDTGVEGSPGGAVPRSTRSGFSKSVVWRLRGDSSFGEKKVREEGPPGRVDFQAGRGGVPTCHR